MSAGLDPAFRRLPLAHRALHDIARGRPENSRAAIAAAMDRGYGIEIDLQPSCDGIAMVFHDDQLDRLTQETGPITARRAEALARIKLRHGKEGIPRLSEVLSQVAGKVPLLLELKDQHGQMGHGDGVLEAAVANDLMGYDGPVAVMSFNPEMVVEMARLCPDVPRGIVTCAYRAEHWPDLPENIRAILRGIPDYARADASFISHEVGDLDRARVTDLQSQGADILCWTVRSPEIEAVARRVADNITFEGYLPRLSA